jgi:predicted small metal-binding protein
MKHLKCSDVSGAECSFEAHGETAEDTKAALDAHGKEAHAEMLSSASDEQKAMMKEKMDSMMTDDEDSSEDDMGMSDESSDSDQGMGM